MSQLANVEVKKDPAVKMPPPSVTNDRAIALQYLNKARELGHITENDYKRISTLELDIDCLNKARPYLHKNIAAESVEKILDKALALGNISKETNSDLRRKFREDPKLKSDPDQRYEMVREYQKANKLSTEINEILANEETQKILPKHVRERIQDKNSSVETRHFIVKGLTLKINL